MAGIKKITRRLPLSVPKWFIYGVLLMALLTGCSTRQVSDTLEGSTAQRLVTYSLEEFIVELADQPELSLKNNTVHLGVHFLHGHPMLDYAKQLLSAQLELVHGIRFSVADEPADYKIDVFFNSIGTDVDDFGLTLPTLGFVAPVDSRIELLALDMFHGVTEGHAIVKQQDDGSIARTKRILKRVRRDNITTPLFEIPVNQLD